jgi:hypothetical protein
MTIDHENCKGAVFYISVHSLASEAVRKEIDLVLEKRNACPGFFVFAVLIGGKSIPHLIKKLYFETEDTKLVAVLPLAGIMILGKLFTDEKIYLVRDEEHLDSYHQKILTNLSECGVVLDQASVENELAKENKLNAYGQYPFGRFYTAEEAQHIFLPQANIFKERNGSWYIRLEDGTVRKAETINWIILDYKDGIMQMISERALEKITGRDIVPWLNEVFPEIAFTEEERALLEGPVRTLTYEEYEHYADGHNINPGNDCFWLNSINKRKEQNMLMYVNGSRVDQVGCRKDRKNGIRPVIKIHKDNM